MYTFFYSQSMTRDKECLLMHSNLQLYQEEEENWHQNGDVNIFFLYKIPFMAFILL